MIIVKYVKNLLKFPFENSWTRGGLKWLIGYRVSIIFNVRVQEQQKQEKQCQEEQFNIQLNPKTFTLFKSCLFKIIHFYSNLFVFYRAPGEIFTQLANNLIGSFQMHLSFKIKSFLLPII